MRKKAKELIEQYFNEQAIKELVVCGNIYVVEEIKEDSYIYGLCNYFIDMEQTFKGNRLEEPEFKEELIRYDVSGFVEIGNESFQFNIDYFKGDYELLIN